MQEAAGEGRWGYAGWRVVLAAHLGVFVSFGSLLVFTFSVFLKPLASEFGWSRESISAAFGVAAMTVAGVSPFLGILLDRHNPRRIIVPCMIVFGLAIASLGLLTGSVWHLYAVFFLLGLVGNGTTQMGYAAVVSTWFQQRRGMALAMVIAGTGLGSMLLPPAAQGLIDGVGWRGAYFTLGGLVLCLGVPLTLAYVRRAPLREGQPAARHSTGGGVRDALAGRAFWLIVGALFLSSVAVNGAITHLAALLNDRGVPAQSAALAPAMLGGMSLAGRLITGWFLDRFSGPHVSAALLATMSAGILLLARAGTLAEGLIAAGLIGLGMGGEADVTPYLLSRYFGLGSFSTLYGITWSFYAIAGAAGPVLMGRAFDATGSYGALLTTLTAPAAVSAVLMLLMPRSNARL